MKDSVRCSQTTSSCKSPILSQYGIPLSFLDSSLRYILVLHNYYTLRQKPYISFHKNIDDLSLATVRLKSNLRGSDFRCASLAVSDSFGVFGAGSMRNQISNLLVASLHRHGCFRLIIRTFPFSAFFRCSIGDFRMAY